MDRNYFDIYLIAHEKAHFNRARELGYDAKYWVEFMGSSTIILLSSGVYVSERMPSPEHKVLIALAPENPSERDFVLARECGGRGEK
jgi:hypothetical protein